uniref:meiosis-specific kinetochore protein-like isoform X2 n=1 Tax=Pristiophorus japonicus TaxID=55135 RepID=UPI00398EE28C
MNPLVVKQGDVMAQFKGKSNWKQMRANTRMNQCSTPAPSNGKRNVKPSSKLKKLSFIHEETDSKLPSTHKRAPGGHRSLHLSRSITTVQRNISKNKKRMEPFQNRSPSLQQRKKCTQSNDQTPTYFVYTETSSECSLTSEALLNLLPSLDSELLVDSSSSSTSTDSCSSVELFRGAEEHTTCMNQEDVSWFCCKNSTLLDSSKAANIDVIAQPSNLSDILEQTGNVTTEACFNRDHVSDGTKVHESSRAVSITLAGKTVSKLQASNEITLEQKRIHATSLAMKQKKPMNEEPSSNPKKTKCKKKVNFADPLKIEYTPEFCRIKPLSPEFPVQLEKQVLGLKEQDKLPICSIILAPDCYQPSKVWQYEHMQPWTMFENAPTDIIIDYLNDCACSRF